MHNWRPITHTNTQPDAPRDIYLRLDTLDVALLAKPLYCEIEFLPTQQPVASEVLAVMRVEADNFVTTSSGREQYGKPLTDVRLNPLTWHQRIHNYFATLKNIRQLDNKLEHDRDFIHSQQYLEPSASDHWQKISWLERRRLRAIGRSLGRIATHLHSAHPPSAKQ